jgi:hypothetical protein
VIKERLNREIGKLDWQKERQELEQRGILHKCPVIEYKLDQWTLQFSVIPVAPKYRGLTEHEFVAAGPLGIVSK